MIRPIALLSKFALGAAVLVSACATGATDATTSTTVPDTPQPASSLEEVRAAVVRIEAEGTFEYPSGTSYNEAGAGSGFFISGDGFIVTNNHVVAGAGRIKVHVDGGTEPFNGRIVGTSECADLAVVNIDAEDRTYLAWVEGEIKTGQDIYVAGFPLGDPEYTLIDGIISKEKAFGDSDWASVEAVLEHTGDTLPGSSGGPIVNIEGLVLGVNYAGDDFGQAFGISADVARVVVDDIVAGEPTLSIGINGWAHEDEHETGIWVSSVVPDSPADRVGIRAGDFITRLAGLIVSEDGTLASYCDILDTHSPDLPFKVEVWREGQGEYLEGVINSDQRLQVSKAVIDTSNAVDSSVWTDLPPGIPYEEHELVWDDTEEVSLELPIEWSDRLSGDWEEYEETVGTSLIASPDLDAWAESWQTPGVFVGVSSTLAEEGIDPHQFLSGLDVEDCDFADQVPYDDGVYVGALNVWVDCGGVGSVFVDWAATSPTGDTLLSAQFVIVSEADLDATVHALETLFLTADLDY